MAAELNRTYVVSWVALAILFIAVAPASAQKNKKGQQPAADSTGTTAIVLPDDRAIDQNISMMLAAWQIGDADKMHEYYAEDAVVVSGGWEPPISGWANYLTAYQAQRAHMSSVRLDRTNSYIKVIGNAAWATYQWEFNGLVNGALTTGRGNTSLVFEKRDGRWLIVLNHTSVVSQGPPAPPAKPSTP